MLYEQSNGNYYLANAVSSSAMNVVALATTSVSTGQQCQLMSQGFFNNPSWTWTVGGSIFVSNTTAGGLTQTLPATSGNIDQYVGYAVSATEIYFAPNAITVGR